MTIEEEQELNRYALRARIRLFSFMVIFLCVLAAIGMLAMAGTIYFPTKTEPAVLTAFIAITSGLIGSLTTLLMTAIQAERRLSAREVETSVKTGNHPQGIEDQLGDEQK